MSGAPRARRPATPQDRVRPIRRGARTIRHVQLSDVQAGRGGALGTAARAGLSVLTLGFSAGARLRRFAYDRGILPSRSLGVRTVSVGNVTAGGTGKTPFVAWLAGRALARGGRPGLLSRGYGPAGQPGGLSDEGRLLEELLGGRVPQVEDPDRVRGGRTLRATHPEVDLVLLDDGFQHRRLARDVDIVLLDATNPFGFGRLLPRGLLREPLSSLRRAHAVVVTRCERLDVATLARLLDRVRNLAPDALVATARTRAEGLLDREGSRRELAGLAGVPVHAWAGIGNPEAFAATLTDAGARVVGRTFARDHHLPTEADQARVLGAAQSEGAALVVVTRKDLVKLRGLPVGALPLVALDASTEVGEGAEALLDLALGASPAV